MNREITPTRFAPAERHSKEEVLEYFKELSEKPLLAQILDAIPDICLILNPERQIVFANRALLDLLKVKDRSAVCGLRPGEAFNCTHASESEPGCGTTEFCGTCGAVKAIMNSHSGIVDVQECRIIRENTGEALDVRVWATPIVIDGEKYTVVTLVDISHEKRRRVLERIFFHDILNTASVLKGFSELLGRATKNAEKFRERIRLLSTRLIEDVHAQQAVLAAESNELSINPGPLHTLQCIEELVAGYSDQGDLADRFIRIDPASEDVAFVSDPALLRRVVGNLLKNALEASKTGETVTIGSRRQGKGVELWVHNPGVMSRDTQLQVFQRSFSTKGTGRGLGTYSVKLLTERYLKGRVSFSSSAEEGTVFSVFYPLYVEPDHCSV